MITRYGGPWQEFRAYAATIMIDLALKVSFRCAMDMMRGLAEVERDERCQRVTD